MNALPSTILPDHHGVVSSLGAAPGSVARLLDQNRLCPHFQPIVCLQTAAVFAHEALIRGPVGHPLASPLALFEQARTEGLETELELRCIQLAMDAWAQDNRPGKLFVNLSANALCVLVERQDGAGLRHAIQGGNLGRGSLVVELTEHERVEDMDALHAAVTWLRAHQVEVALDDFGDGRSSLRLWAEIKPAYVKIDKYFIKGIAHNPDKVQTVKALKRIAETFGSTMVAEGIEQDDELRVCRDLELGLAQGYRLGRPSQRFCRDLPQDVLDTIQGSLVSVLPHPARPARAEFSLSSLLVPCEPLLPTHTVHQLNERFMRHPDVFALPVVENGRTLGLIDRNSYLGRAARPYFFDLFGKQSCLTVANLQPITLECHATLDELTHLLTSEDQRYLREGFVITRHGHYAGVSSGERLVRAVTELRIEAARHANPLTFLPGNIPLSIHIEKLLRCGTHFVACYADLNNFKPFNDRFGYWKGDEMIKLVAKAITQASDPSKDFVGHVGGDDFLVLFQSPDWHERVQHMVEMFNAEAHALFDSASRAQGSFEVEDRYGVLRHVPLTTLTAGVVMVQAGMFRDPEEVASAAAKAKHASKQRPGGISIVSPSGNPASSPVFTAPKPV